MSMKQLYTLCLIITTLPATGADTRVILHAGADCRPFSYVEDDMARGNYVDIFSTAFLKKPGYCVGVGPVRHESRALNYTDYVAKIQTRVDLMQLKGDGYIRLAGGCEVHGEVNISLKPVGELVLLEVENHQYMFDDDSLPVGPFVFKLTKEEASIFLTRIISGIESVSAWTESGTTRDKSLVVFFPMETESLQAQLYEYSMDDELDPIMEMIEDFVLEHRPESALEAGSNSTQDFLGEGEDIKHAKIELSDAHMLYEGDNILVLLNGRALIQSLSLSESPSTMLLEKRYSCQLGTEDIEGIVNSLVAGDLIALDLQDRTGQPDELRISISITNYKSQTREISVWRDHHLGPIEYRESTRKRFDNIRQVLQLVDYERQRLSPRHKRLLFSCPENRVQALAD